MTGSTVPRQWAASAALMVALSLLILLPVAGQVYRSPADVAFSPDGRWLAVSDATAEKLVLVESGDLEVARDIQLHGKGAGVVWANDGSKVYVAESDNATIAEIVPETGEVLRRFTVRLRPYGLVLAEQSGLMVVTNTDYNTVSLIDLASAECVAEVEALHAPFGIALVTDEKTAFIGNNLPYGRGDDPRQSASITMLDLESRATSHIPLPPGSGNVRELVCSPCGKYVYAVHTLGRTNLPTTQLERGWVNTNALSILNVAEAKHECTVLLDHPMEGAADPWGIVCEPDGNAIWISLSGRHQLARIDLPGLHNLISSDPEASRNLVNDLSGLYRAGLIERVSLPGQAPRGIDFSQGRLAVGLYFSGTVAMVDTLSKKVTTTVAIGDNPPADFIRKGEIAFFNADHCFQNWLSCVTCHPNGGRADGFNWDLLNDGIGNPKNTRSMVWSYLTPPVMSLAVRADMETAAKAGFIHIQFVVPEEETVEATRAYLRYLKPMPSPFLTPDGRLTEAAKRGKALFMSKETGCAICHTPPLYTDLGLYDVGTKGEYDRKSAFDTPTLVELYQTGPYLHDGSAVTLEEVLKERNPEDLHGHTSHLTPEQLKDLAEFLKSL